MLTARLGAKMDLINPQRAGRIEGMQLTSRYERGTHDKTGGRHIAANHRRRKEIGVPFPILLESLPGRRVADDDGVLVEVFDVAAPVAHAEMLRHVSEIVCAELHAGTHGQA